MSSHRRPFHSSSSSSSSSSAPWELSPAQPPTIRPPASADTSLPLSEQLRALMRLIPLPVVACTATMPAAAAASVRAMTMSSFMTLTLRPTPVVSLNVATPSRTLEAVAAARLFNIHVLAGDAAGARVANWLAGGNRPAPAAAGAGAGAVTGASDGVSGMVEGLREACGCDLIFPEMGNKRAGETDTHTYTEAPVLRGPGILYVLRCKLLDEEGTSRGLIRIRDRVIVLGDVLEVLRGQETASGEQTQAASPAGQSFALIYADRMYRQLGLCVKPPAGETDQ